MVKQSQFIFMFKQRDVSRIVYLGLCAKDMVHEPQTAYMSRAYPPHSPDLNPLDLRKLKI
jgi:hypothetical protein